MRFYKAISYSLLMTAVLLAACSGSKTDFAVTLPQTDSRDVRYVRLENDMQLVLISDPSADKAAASLDVRIGSRQDPWDRQGLAHFLEHMLFLGTEKYPDAGEYQSFVSSRGGSHNAYTSFEHTNYFFDVGADHLEQGLDRFAQFFISPLFNTEFVMREVNAVDSEYQARIQNDYRRALDVFKELINPDHPLAKFTVGNLSTLLGGRGESALRQSLLDFYSEYYSANRMSLVVIGRESLDELQSMVGQRFSKVKNNKVEIEDIELPLLKESPMQFSLKPRKELRELSISFPVPDLRARYHEKALNYIGHILGHESEGSLLYLLKAKGWAERLRAGSSVEFAGGALFSVDLDLTPAGMANVDDVSDAVFEAIALLRDSGVEAWRYQELADIARLQFDFRTRPDEINEVSQLARNLHYYSPDDVIRGDYVMEVFNADLIQSVLEAMTVNNAVVAITRPDLIADKESQLYAVPYKVALPSEEVLERWRQRTGLPGLTLPKPNPFIATSLDIKEGAAGDTPKRIIDTDRVAAWHMLDKRFQLPKGNLNILIRSPSASRDASRQAAAEIWVRMVRDELNAYTYPAQLAGLNYSLQAEWDGLSLSIRGFDDKQGMLLDSIASRLANPQWDEVRFRRVKMDYIRDLENNEHNEPYRYLSEELSQTVRRYRWSAAERLVAANQLGLKEVKAYSRELMSATQIYVQAHGNYSEIETREFANIAADFLLGDRIPDAQPQQIRRIPVGDFGKSYKTEHADAGLIWYLQAPDSGHRARIVMGIAGQMLGAEFFHKLRTEKQLGYVVSAGVYPVREVPGLYFMAQSPVADTQKLQSEFKGFLKAWLDDGLSEDKFTRHKQALRAKLKESPRNLWEAGDRFWQDLMNGYTQFDSQDRLVAVLDDMGYDTWQRELREALADADRRSLWLQMGGRWGEKALGTEALPGPQSVGKKRQYYLYEHPKIGRSL
ncbi:MAG: insulysin [Paracoccaceae bacterium]|jgi:insulysin